MSSDKYNKIQLKQIHHLYEQVKARRNKANNAQFMNELRENQTRHNYKMEYDRIRSALGNSLIPHDTKTTINNRMSVLDKLIKNAL